MTPMWRFLYLFFAFFIAGPAFADSWHKGMHTGPYLLGSGGLQQLSWDINARTQKQEGNRSEPLAGFTFGWHLNDWLSPELETRYTTSNNAGRREHMAIINIGVSNTLLWRPLMGVGSFNFFPYCNANLGVGLASLPGDLNASDDRLSVFSIGPGIAGGIRVQWKRYIYFGVQAQEDYLYHSDKSQNIAIGGVVTREIVYDGGFKPQFALQGMVGVHY